MCVFVSSSKSVDLTLMFSDDIILAEGSCGLKVYNLKVIVFGMIFNVLDFISSPATSYRN